MAELLSIRETLQQSMRRDPSHTALVYRDSRVSYADLVDAVDRTAERFSETLTRGERVAVYLDKRPEAAYAILGAAVAQMVVVPINTALKRRQVFHILKDSGAKILITSPARAAQLKMDALSDAVTVVSAGALLEPQCTKGGRPLTAAGLSADQMDRPAAILYTSGSTGTPKGVVVSHSNLLHGALSVNSYLHQRPDDVILSVLPWSFDAGLSQLTSGLFAGATLVLTDFLRGKDVANLCLQHRVTSMTAVPPLWRQIADAEWPTMPYGGLRVFANTGGHMPRSLLRQLRELFPQARPYLMYGFTEAFRSTYLDPGEVSQRPDSVGKAVPHASLAIIAADGSRCGPYQTGELVHSGPLVTLGYWNDPAATAKKFRPLPEATDGSLAAWSGDHVYQDEDGFIYFVGRIDGMIKSSGYRLNHEEIEEAILEFGAVREVSIIAVPHQTLGQALVAYAVPNDRWSGVDDFLHECRRELPTYMVPIQVVPVKDLARTPNGKIDRQALLQRFLDDSAVPQGDLQRDC